MSTIASAHPDAPQRPSLPSKLKRPLIVLVFVSAIALIIGVVVFRSVGNWLVVQSLVPQKIDVVFTFGGELARNFYSKELFLRNSGSFWLMSGESKKNYFAIIGMNGLDSTHYGFVDTCTNTLSEVNCLKQWAAQYQKSRNISRPLTIALVSSPYHMRRVFVLAQKMIENQDLVYLPVPLERYGNPPPDYRHWWRDKVLKKRVPVEVKKCVYLWLFT